MKFYSLLLLSLVIFSCSSPKKEKNSPVIVNENTFSLARGNHPEISVTDIVFENFFLPDTSQHYRGLVFHKNGFYYSGSKGQTGYYSPTFLSNGESGGWSSNNPDSLHFRDIHILNETPILMNIGSPGYIKREVGNNKWVISYQDPNPNIFMDGMDFWDNGSGLIYGDPLDEYHFILKTTDYGLNFKRLPKSVLPEVLKDEAGFAASGTGVVCVGNGVTYIGYGGEKARVFKSTDYGESWTTIDTPIKHGAAGKGIYCMAFKDELNGVVAGGNWENATGDSTVAYTNDGGETWTLGKFSSGYRSGICHVKDNVYLSVGTAGTDISFDNGATWKQLDYQPFNAIQANDKEAVAVGNHGSAIHILF